jgi:hypothetical protein
MGGEGDAAVAYLEEREPQGWRQLCAKLRTEKNPERFQALLDQINRLLSAHEKAAKPHLTLNQPTLTPDAAITLPPLHRR